MIRRFKLQAPSALAYPTHALFRLMRLTFLSAATDKVALSGSRRLLACLPTETVLLPDGRGTPEFDTKLALTPIWAIPSQSNQQLSAANRDFL